jgi:hypothetical protein
MDKLDKDALALAVETACKEPLRAKQIRSKMRNEGWRKVAEFAAYCCQCDALRLKPWQIPPLYILNVDDPNDGLSTPDQYGMDGRYEAAKLLKRMLAAGVSRYHPDPEAAIEEATKATA